MKIISRKEWGATAGDGNGERPLPLSTLWLHHSVTKHLPQSATVAQECEQMRAIERIGVARFGAHYGFPYTFAVFPSGRAYEGHRLDQRGAHTAGHNTDGAGICWPGNYDVNTAGAKVQEGTAQLVAYLSRTGRLRRAAFTGGHRDSVNAVRLAGATACPGRYAHPLVGSLNRRISALLSTPAAPAPKPAPPVGRTDARGRYTVKPGDSLSAIAATFRTSVEALQLLNGISDPDRISAGATLYTRWIVGRGNTLSEIAAAAGTSVSTLVRLNGIRNADAIEIGQLIRLP